MAINRKRDILVRYKKIINVILFCSRIVPKRIYLMWYRLIRSHDNKLAIFIRYIILKNCTKSCGDNVAVFSNVYLYSIRNLEIGNNVSIHPLCYINAVGSMIIGSDVSIAHGTTILTEEHIHLDKDINIKDQGTTFDKVTIKDNVWIGCGVRILSGVTINSGSIVAAGAVVTKDTEEFSINGGVPAKKIKERI